jgi:reductive dehalogenase
MEPESKTDHPIDLNRRNFFKLGAASAVAGTSVAAALPTKALAKASQMASEKQILDEMPMKISPSYKRFHQKNHAFCQAFTPNFPEGRKVFPLLSKPADQPGHRLVDKALIDAGWYANDLLSNGSQLGVPNTTSYNLDNKVGPEKYPFASPKEAAMYMKKAARFLGADLVGITPYDERWTYASFYNPFTGEDIPADLPFTPKSVIVMAFEMDYEAMTTAPSGMSGGAVGLGYSKMSIVGASFRKYINDIGYKAFATGNDIALSVPYGVAAGLGEGARNGILVTYEYGPRVRIGKIFTEMDLAYDKPVSFGVTHFCEDCRLCADACPGKAISQDKKPSFKVVNECNNKGVEKWAIDAKKCLLAWGKTETDCCTCITSCPYNKPDFWHHRLVDKINRFMPGSVHSVMREMDKLFGYGNSFDETAMNNFWKS